MKKIISIVISFLLISIIFLSGCTQEGLFTDSKGPKPTFIKFACDKNNGDQPLTVKFSATGSSEEGDKIFYYWDFGDGKTSTAQNPTHTFQNPGIYKVTCTIENVYEVTNQKTVAIYVNAANLLPEITAFASPTTGWAPLTVSFTASATDSDGTIVSYHWDFKDRTTSNEQNPTHTFQTRKRYPVLLTVTDNEGGISTKTIVIIAKGNSEPVARPSADITSGTAPLTVKFTGSGKDSDGSIVSYYWDFKDGGTSNQQNPTHTFNTVGNHKVTLTVKDNEGAEGSDSISIRVLPGEQEDPIPPSTTKYTFSPVDDAYVDVDFPDKKFGVKDKNLLSVKTYESEWMDNNYQYTYLKFDVSSLPVGSKIYSAKLKLHIYMALNILDDPYMRVHKVDDDSWSESTITFNNQPYLYTNYIARKMLNVGDDYLEWDISSYVKYHSDNKISLRISSSDSGNVVFYSDESFLCDDNEHPILELQVVV